MPELGPCPLCGDSVRRDEDLGGDFFCDCGFCWNAEGDVALSQLTKHAAFHRRYKDEPVEEALELWRLLEWAITNRLQISQYEDGHTWVYRDSGLVGGFIGFATGDTMIDAIREAKKKLEARPAFLPGVFTISRRIP